MKSALHDKLESLEPQYQKAFKNARGISFDLSYAWFDNLIKTALKPTDNVRIFTAENDAGQCVVIPMRVDGSGDKVGKLRSLTNFYTALYAPIGTGSASVSLLACALARVQQDNPCRASLEFSPLAPEADSFTALFQALRTNGWLPFKYFCFGNWYLRVNGRSYAEYYKDLPSRMQNTIKRKQKQFLATRAARLAILTQMDEIAQGIADYSAVYATSWKVPEPFPDFTPGLIRMAAEQGWLRLGVAYLNEQPIAAQLWIVAQGRAAIFKLAYDEQYATYSAGTILSAHLFQYAIDVDKVEEIDYLIGDDGYKKDWMSHRRERWGIIAYNPRTFMGLVGIATQLLSDVRKQYYLNRSLS